jgi:hypothetical protein
MVQELAEVVYVADRDLKELPMEALEGPKRFDGMADLALYGVNGVGIDYAGIRKH